VSVSTSEPKRGVNLLAIKPPSRGVLLAFAGVAGAAGLAALDYRVAAVMTAAMLIAGWIWNPTSGQPWERFGAVLVTQIALFVPVAFAARWLSWHLTWALIVLLLGAVALAGVAVSKTRRLAPPATEAKPKHPLDSWRVTKILQVGVVVLPTLVVALPYLTRNAGGHLWLFSRGFDNTAHFNVMSAVAKTGTWPWGEQYADVSGQLIFSPALPQQVWALLARVMALGSLPSGDVLVVAFAAGQVLAYAFLCYGILLLFRRVASFDVLTQAGKWVWVYALALLILLLSIGSSITLVLNGFANYAWAIAGLTFCLAGAMLLGNKNYPLSLTLIIAGGVVATMSYAPLVIVSVVIAVLAAWSLKSAGAVGTRLGGLLLGVVISTSALVVALLALSIVRSLLAGEDGKFILGSVYFFPLEALAVSGGIEAIPVFAMAMLLLGALVYLLFAWRQRSTFAIKVAFAALATVLLITALIGAYSLQQTGQLSYYTIKFQYALLVLLMPFFVGALVLLFAWWQPRPLLGVISGAAILIVASQAFGYSLPVAQAAFLRTGLPPNYISPGLAWLQLTNDSSQYPGFPGAAIAEVANRPADGVVVVWNPPDLDATQERGAQIYPNSMRYTGDTWVWSLANTLLGTSWGDEALDQLWNWRWSNQRRPVTIYTFSESDFQKVSARLPEFVAPEVTSGLYPCVQDRTCVTEVVLVTLESG